MDGTDRCKVLREGRMAVVVFSLGRSRLYGSQLSPTRLSFNGPDHTLPNQEIGGFCGVRNFLHVASAKSGTQGYVRRLASSSKYKKKEQQL